LLIAMSAVPPALAQKQGGTLRGGHFDSGLLCGETYKKVCQ
jgi:hypothetical protein